jgi:hypothetical protein
MNGDKIMAAIRGYERLQGLTNEQLAQEVLNSPIGDDVTSAEWDLIAEMLTRLDPHWHELTPEEEAEEATRIAGLARDTPAPTGEGPGDRTPPDEPSNG